MPEKVVIKEEVFSKISDNDVFFCFCFFDGWFSLK